MPDAGRQMWEIRIPKGVEFHSMENRKMSKNKNIEKGTKRKIENQRKMNCKET